MDEYTIGALVRKLQNSYVYYSNNISKYVSFSMYETIEKIDAYINSVHISGDKDSLGRDKPFFNVVTAARNIWYRATDIDRKDIRIKATQASHYLPAFLATIHLQEWMRREGFGKFLNEWGRVLATYGSAVVKFVEQDGELKAVIPAWNRLIVDPIQFESNVKIERFYLTPAELRRKKEYDQEVVKGMLDALTYRKTLNNQRKDIRNDYVELYEVHGELPLSYLTGNDDDKDTYVQQMHVVSFYCKKEKGKSEYQDFTLYKGREAKDPYLITHLIKEDGRTLGIGAVEHLFEAQWMVNHTAKAIKDQLDLASRLIFQTSDTNYVGRNVLTAIETGDIMIHSPNQPLTAINNAPQSVASLQSYAQQWMNLAKEITSTPDAIQGNTMPSGTAFRQVALLNQEAHSLFELMTENKGLAIEEMMREFVIPFLKKKMDTSEEIAATLEAHDIKRLDAMYVPSEAARRSNKKIIDMALNGKSAMLSPMFQQQDLQSEAQNVQGELSKMGNQRFIKPSDIGSKTWKSVLKDLEWKVEVEVTGEDSDKQATLETLNTVLKTIASNPAILQDPNAKLVFAKILEAAGSISPIEISAADAPQPQGQPEKIAQSISFKDLPPDGQEQLARKAGINIKPSANTNEKSIQAGAR